MITLGLDIGTTTISAVVLEDGSLLTSRTAANNSFITTGYSWEKSQDPHKIISVVLSLINELTTLYPGIERIGVTGQQHGILYLDSEGNPVSPLYTWQDERGSLPYDQIHSYTSFLSAQTNRRLSTGFGLVTHFYNLKNQLVPPSASTFCTIADYTAMVLADLTKPAIHPSNADSFGLFDPKIGDFEKELISENGIDTNILPAVSSQPLIGMYKTRIPVFTAIGDNQASFIGATNGAAGAILVNIGTGAQFSAYSTDYIHCDCLETRPFIKGAYLMTGASLCGGRSYALLESFFRSSAEMVLNSPVPSCYSSMSRLLDSCPEPEDVPCVVPLFQGTRDEPDRRASISGLSTENFRPLNLIYGTMYGMADELYKMYENYILQRKSPAYTILYGAGNALRKNPHLCRIIEKRFRLPLILSSNEEEAACGAALFAGMK